MNAILLDENIPLTKRLGLVADLFMIEINRKTVSKNDVTTIAKMYEILFNTGKDLPEAYKCFLNAMKSYSAKASEANLKNLRDGLHG